MATASALQTQVIVAPLVHEPPDYPVTAVRQSGRGTQLRWSRSGRLLVRARRAGSPRARLTNQKGITMESDDLRRTVNEIQGLMHKSPLERKAEFIRNAVIAIYAADRTRHGMVPYSGYSEKAEKLWAALPEEYR